MIQRRSFLASILAAGVAPAAVGSSILMPVKKIIKPVWGVSSAQLMANEWIAYQQRYNRMLRLLMDNMSIAAMPVLAPGEDLGRALRRQAWELAK